MYQSFRRKLRGPDGSSTRIPNTIECLGDSSNPNLQTAGSLASESTQIPGPFDRGNQAAHLTGNAQNEVIIIGGEHLSDTRENAKIPHPTTDPHNLPGAEPTSVDASLHTAGHGTGPTHSPNHPYEGAAPPPADVRAPSSPPFGRVRIRGAFVIGNGAPIKIDESIGVYLRDGANGEVDLII